MKLIVVPGRLVNLVATQGVHRAALVNITFVAASADGFVVVWQPEQSCGKFATATSKC